MAVRKVKAVELIFDWSLWPRHKAESLDSTNLRQIRDALRAGVLFPPVIISHDMRIVDGFHRTRAVLDVGGPGATICAEVRMYKNDADMFLDAGRLNNHGLKLGPIDRAHFILKAQKMSIPNEAIASVLGMDREKMIEFVNDRTAINPDGETIPLPAGARNLAGLVLTREQEHFARTANGCLPGMYARMLINALKADALTIDRNTMKLLGELSREIELALDGVPS